MRPVLYTTLVVLAVFALAIGCKKDDEQKPNPRCMVACHKIYPQFSFINFPTSDVDTVIVSTFIGTDNYTNLSYTDTLLTYQNESNHQTFNKYFYPDSSYTIITSSKKDTFRITNIKIDDEVHEMEGTRRGCYGLYCGAYPHDATVNGSPAKYDKRYYNYRFTCSIYVLH